MLNDKQYEQLLKPLNPARIAKRSGGGRQLSYLEAWDVKAHLNRIFGFVNWSADVIESSLAFEEKNEKGQWHVAYKVTLRLRIHTGSIPEPTYTEAAVGFSTLPSRGEAHDMAIKTAESDALKRAAINLGTQFGLSLYNNGSPKDVVGTTLDRDAVDNVEIVEDLIEEIPEDNVWIDRMKSAVDSKDVPALLDIKKEMNDNGVNDLVYQGTTLAKWLDKAVVSAGKK
jgi:recombination DNA repair RAD52 pathway protein